MAKNKKVYSFDEKSYAEEILKNGFPSGVINSYSMYMLSKYYREVYNYGAVKLERALISFCESQNPDFNVIVESDNIKKWVRIGMGNTLRKVENIVITQNEMNVIKTITNLKHRKVIFITLVMAKSVNVKSNTTKYFIHYSKLPKIADMIDFKITEIGLVDILHEFVKSGLLTPYNQERESILVNFANDDGPVAMTIKNPDKALEYYKIYFGGDVYYCPNCKAEMVKTGNKQTVCKNCAKEIKKEQTRKSMRKIRKM